MVNDGFCERLPAGSRIRRRAILGLVKYTLTPFTVKKARFFLNSKARRQILPKILKYFYTFWVGRLSKKLHLHLDIKFAFIWVFSSHFQDYKVWGGKQFI